MKKRALVIAPGRGTYNKPELGYYAHHHSDKTDLLAEMDKYRATKGQTTISELDSRPSYSIKEHTRGDNASPLIYGCAYGDFLSINRDEYDIIGVTGNSMGWYIALACAGALSFSEALHLINTMGGLMQDSLIGGQLIYPFIDENWQIDHGLRASLFSIMDEVNQEDGAEVFTSIELGGLLVMGGNQAALKLLKDKLPPRDERFPLILPNHAAFHTPLQKPIAAQAKELFTASMFKAPDIPMIDGRGHIWRPFSSDNVELYDYTLGHQVYEHYDFTSAIQVSVKEYAPDCLIILGPGTTLGGAVAQSLIPINWEGMDSKAAFSARQKSDPYILAMGIDEQRKLVCA